jgi:hypothetical protein
MTYRLFAYSLEYHRESVLTLLRQMTQKESGRPSDRSPAFLGYEADPREDRSRKSLDRLRVNLEWLGRARLTIDAELHCRVADERDDSDGDYREQEFHLALLSRSAVCSVW